MSSQRISTIVYQLRPEIEHYLKRLVRAERWFAEKKHQMYNYPDEVRRQQCFPQFAVFYDFLVRREICFLRGFDATDEVAESYRRMLEEFDRLTVPIDQRVAMTAVNGRRILINRWNVVKLRVFLFSYDIYKNLQYYQTIGILEHIFNTSMIHLMAEGMATVRFRQQFINMDNIRDILKFVRKWCHQVADCDRPINGNFFEGEADLILDNCIMDVEVSNHEPGFIWSRFKKVAFMMIFWALGYFKQTGIRRTTFKVYNPLKGKVYILDLPKLNFDRLDEMLDRRPCWRRPTRN